MESPQIHSLLHLNLHTPSSLSANMAITLKDATLPQDFHRVGELIVDAWQDYSFWTAIQHEATREDAVAWMRDRFAGLFSKPYHHFYVLVDEQNG